MLLLFLNCLPTPLVCPRVMHMFREKVFVIHFMFLSMSMSLAFALVLMSSRENDESGRKGGRRRDKPLVGR